MPTRVDGRVRATELGEQPAQRSGYSSAAQSERGMTGSTSSAHRTGQSPE